VLARLILTVLLAALALPATAAMPCHDDAPMVGESMHHAPASPDRAIPAHICIGCVPPSSWRAARIEAPTLLPATPAPSPLAALAAGPTHAPDPPPPRTSA
jgi:hypothetical protein